MTQLPNAGTHVGRTNGNLVVYEAESGALCVAVPVMLSNSEIAWHGKHTVTIVSKEGEVKGRAIQTLKEIFGWDGVDPFALTEADYSEVEFELVCEHEEFTPEGKDEPVQTFKVKWLNPLGGGSRMPEPADRKSILAKYGNKFRALSGGAKPTAAATKTAAAPAEKKAAAPAAAPAKPGPAKPGPSKPAPAKKAPEATMEEAWAACEAANPTLNEEQKAEAWYGKMKEFFDTDDNEKLSPADFGKLKAAFEE